MNKKAVRASGIVLIIMALVLVAGLGGLGGLGMPAQAQEEEIDRYVPQYAPPPREPPPRDPSQSGKPGSVRESTHILKPEGGLRSDYALVIKSLSNPSKIGVQVKSKGRQEVRDAVTWELIDVDVLTTDTAVWYWDGNNWVEVDSKFRTRFWASECETEPQGDNMGTGWYAATACFTGIATAWRPPSWYFTKESDAVWLSF